MVSTQDLLKICDKENIMVETADCPLSGSISILLPDGSCYIGIDSETPENEILERHAHEIGHCVKGAFYNRFSHFDIISRYETRADNWAIELICPYNELIKQIKKYNDNVYLLSQYFNVSEDFMIKACKHYGIYHEAI